MKVYTYILLIAIFSCVSAKSVQQKLPGYTITKIEKLDDGQVIIYVHNNSESGIVISQNVYNLGKLIGEIQIGEKVCFRP